jgi:RND family efflux transporter MFP subunit
MKHWKKILLGAIGCILLFLGISWWMRPVALVVPVVRGKAVDAATGNVEVFSAVERTVHSEARGFVASVMFEPGMGAVLVSKGQVIVGIDPAEVERELILSRSDLRTAEVKMKQGSLRRYDLENLEQDLAHNLKLAEVDQFPEAWVKKQKRAIQQLEQSIEQEEAGLENFYEHQLFRNELLEGERSAVNVKSPLNGTLVDCYVIPGDHVVVGQAVARVISSEHLVRVTLSEDDFKGVQVGQLVSANFLSKGPQLFSGRVTALNPTSDANARRRSVYVSLDLPEDELVVGMTGQASIAKAEHENALLVPRRALLGNKVLVANSGTIELRTVTLGFLGLHLAEVVSGLKEGDMIVVEDLYSFHEGERVRPLLNS